MSIQYAILGLLSWQPLSGYDLKKIMSESDIFYWSGNNNQIYTTLIRLQEENLVTNEIQQNKNFPAKRIYTITDAGREQLRQWVLSTAELPEQRKTFLIQLAWADALSDDELDQLLARYEEEIDVQFRMQQEKAARPTDAPNRTPREAFLWQKIQENITATYRHELDWVRSVRQGLNSL